MASPIRGLEQMKVDVKNLYREELFTDMAMATIQRHTPVKADGSVDPDRAVLYTGQTSLMSEMGTIPLQFVIEAKSLEEAFTLFPKAMEVGYAKMVEELKEMRREQASRIVVPQGPMPNLTGGAPGSAPGKIHLR